LNRAAAKLFLDGQLLAIVLTDQAKVFGQYGQFGSGLRGLF